MPTYRLVVDQHVRYYLSVDVANPQQAAGAVAFTEWDDGDNEVLTDVVRVYDDGKLIGTTDLEQLQLGGLAFSDDDLSTVTQIEAELPDPAYEDDE